MNPYWNVSSGTGIGSESCAGCWHEYRGWRGTKTRVYASLQEDGYKGIGRNPPGRGRDKQLGRNQSLEFESRRAGQFELQ